MKRKILIVCLAMLALNNCANNNTSDSSNNIESSFDSTIESTSSSLYISSQSENISSLESSFASISSNNDFTSEDSFDSSLDDESFSESLESFSDVSYESESIDSSSFVSDDSSELLVTESSATYIINSSEPTANDNENEVFLNQANYTKLGNYQTGNYSDRFSNNDINTISNFTFQHYRAIRSSGCIFTLLPYYGNENDGTIAGAFYNTTKISTISRIFINYKTPEESENGFILNYGDDKSVANSITIPSYQEFACVEIEFTNTSYFKIETIGQQLSIKDIKIYYIDTPYETDPDYLSSGEGDYRINPIKYSGELIDGESYIDLPIDMTFDEKTLSYQINETKRYTYYSYEYIKEHPEFADYAAMTEPRDVINYYLAFEQYPANYFSSAKNAVKSEAYSLFGNKIRQVKGYSRTNGYVNAVPTNKTNIYYLEFDIDVDNTYISSTGSVTRGAGRVVIFTTGYLHENYNDSPVAVYTDDHYSTFQEYLNTGVFGKRFNCQSSRTIYQWGSPMTF